MKNRRLTGMRWRFMKLSAWTAMFTSLLSVMILMFFLDLNFRVLFSLQWLGIPFILLFEAVILVMGAFIGFIYGNEFKKRLEILMESILKFERGHFEYRAADLGDDEVGMMADHLNQMAERVRKQVVSLQKLSTEKAEWNEELKKSIVSEERQRLARELHDAVSQQLFAISMMTSAIQENIRPIDEEVKERIATVEKMAGNAQNEMRALLMHLRPATLEGKGLKEGLEELLMGFEEERSLKIHWEVSDIPSLPKGIEDHFFRIVQEGMSNVFRHSQATSVTVRLGVVNNQVFLRISDNGIGFDMAKSKSSSYGMQSIQERVNEIGGVAEIISFPSKGTQIEVKVSIIHDERKRES